MIIFFSSYIIAKACRIFDSATNYLGRKMGDGVKGATLNAIGSSMPELLTTVFFLAFASQENLGRDLATSFGGNTGSAIFNSIIIPIMVIGVVISIGVRGIKLTKKVILRDGLFLIFTELVLLVLLSSQKITQMHGWILTSLYLVYLVFLFAFMTKKEPESQTEQSKAVLNNAKWYQKYQFNSENGITRRSWYILIIAVLLISLASAGLVESCKGIATQLKINPLFVALILVAAASSIPDTIVSMLDARRGNHDDALSNVLGSNIFDITISLGLPLALFLLITDQTIDFSEAGPTIIDIRVMLVIITAFTLGIFYFAKTLTKRHIVILVLLYTLFILYAIGAASYQPAGDNNLLARIAGSFIEMLRESGFSDLLERLAKKLTGY